MMSNIARQLLMKEVQSAFTERYPYLRIHMMKETDNGLEADASEEKKEIRLAARQLLWEQFGLSDDSKVGELEILLEYEFGRPVQILRKSGNLWLETRMTRHWTLRQQDDHGREIAMGFT